MAVTDACFKAGFTRLTDNYLSGADEDTVRGRRQLYSELVARHAFIDDAIFAGAVQETLDTVQRFLPGTAEFLAICEFVHGEQERAGRKALPPPAALSTGSRPSNAVLLRHIAIGKLRTRYTAKGYKYLLSDVGRDVTTPQFDEEEIASVLEEMERNHEFESLRALPADAPALAALAALGIGTGGAPVVDEWPREGTP